MSKKNPLYKPPPNLINTIFFPKGGAKIRARKRARGKLKGQNTYAGVDFSGDPDRLPVDMFNRTYNPMDIADRLSVRRAGRKKKAY